MHPAQTIIRPCQECAGKKRCPSDPLLEGPAARVRKAREIVTHGFNTLEIMKSSDEAITETFASILRMAPENYKNLGEYVASIMRNELRGLRLMKVLISPINAPSELELEPLGSRLLAMRIGDKIKVEEPGRFDTLASMGSYNAILEQVAFERHLPILLDQETRLRLMFHNLNKDDDGCDVFSLDGMRPPGKDSLAVMPIYYRLNEEPSGLVVMEGDLRCEDSTTRGFAKSYWSARVAMGIATQISFMLTHRYDTLTILPKRADFQVELAQGIRDLKAGRLKSLHVFMIDADDFKSVNTGYGYEGGDKVLSRLADIFRASVGLNDSVFRYGGEEFMIIVRNAGTTTKAVEIAERLRSNVTKTNISVVRPPKDGEDPLPETLRVTCSIGVIDIAEYAHGTNGCSNDEVVNSIADNARKGAETMMRMAKENGKDQVRHSVLNSEI